MERSPQRSGPEDDRIITAFLSGENWACELIDSWILRIVRSRWWGVELEEDDILQQTRLKVLEALKAGKFRRHSSLRTYVCSIAFPTCIDAYRRRKHFGDPIDPAQATLRDPHPSILDEIERKQTVEILKMALNEMPPMCRDILRMVYFDRLRYDEIARQLGIAVGTVKSRVARCKEKVASLFEKYSQNGNLLRERSTTQWKQGSERR